MFSWNTSDVSNNDASEVFTSFRQIKQKSQIYVDTTLPRFQIAQQQRNTQVLSQKAPFVINKTQEIG